MIPLKTQNLCFICMKPFQNFFKSRRVFVVSFNERLIRMKIKSVCCPVLETRTKHRTLPLLLKKNGTCNQKSETFHISRINGPSSRSVLEGKGFQILLYIHVKKKWLKVEMVSGVNIKTFMVSLREN